MVGYVFRNITVFRQGIMVLLALAMTSFGFAQNLSFETGRIIDSVAVINSTDTFTLYLPKNFDKDKPASVVFIFEPAARGTIGIAPFIEASQKFGHILICSNNSRNGLFEKNFTIIDRLFNTVFERFTIDENLIYTAGFSGGSRLATTVAVLTKQIQGIVACGAGFSQNTSHIPSINDSFSYVGLVGNSDMNYQEMQGVKEWLDTFGIENEIFTNEDDHRWPSSDQILKAFNWLELQAYKRNIKPKDDLIISTFYTELYEEGKKLESDSEIELAIWEYERMVRNFSAYYNLDTIKTKISNLKKDKKYSGDSKKREGIKKEEAKLRKVFVEKFNKEISGLKTPEEFNWWHKELENLQKKYLLSEDEQFRKMGYRIGYAIYAMGVETAESQFYKNNAKKRLYCHTIASLVAPDRPYAFYLLAKDYAILNNKDKTLENLSLAISKGLTDKAYITNTTAFLKYKDSVEFIRLLEGLNND